MYLLKHSRHLRQSAPVLNTTTGFSKPHLRHTRVSMPVTECAASESTRNCTDQELEVLPAERTTMLLDAPPLARVYGTVIGLTES
jgi:hypothetical protein